MLRGGDLPIYSIGAVERMLGIPAATVRNWEERYGLLQPAEAHRLLDEHLERGGEFGSTDEGGGAPRLLILLAERDPYAAEFAEFFLRTEGYEVVLALDADDAAGKFEQLLPQLAVVELLISGGTGSALCRRLKEAGVP